MLVPSGSFYRKELKPMRVLLIQSSRDTFIAREDTGYVSRYDLMKFGSRWCITGAVEYSDYGLVARRYSLTDILDGKVKTWKHHHGGQKVFITDVFKGERRVWMNPPHFVVVMEEAAAVYYMAQAIYKAKVKRLHASI
jgi:hypothetical protein